MDRVLVFGTSDVGSIPAGRTKVRGTFCEAKCDGASQGRANFQQKIMPDHKNNLNEYLPKPNPKNT